MGLGRALIYARDHDVSEYREVILDACIHCYSYDTQIEGTRADSMYELVGLLPDRASYYHSILNSLAVAGDDRDAVQRFRFAALLSMDGDEHAKKLMRECYNPGPSYGESIGINFLETEGINGLLFVAEKMRAVLVSKPGESDTGWIISRSVDAFGEQTTWDALRDAGRESPYIEAYREASEGARQHKDPIRRAIPATSYADMLYTIPASKTFLLLKWGQQASDQELELAARGLIAARDRKEQLRHLRIFSRRRYPLDPVTLIDLADVEEERVGFWAVRALAHVTDSAVRDVAFRLVNSDLKWRGEAIALLNKNFAPGDHDIVLRWFEAEADREPRHAFGKDLEKFWEQHPDETTEVRMLRSLYERDPCSHCRYNAVRRIIELDALTEQMRTECAYDANDDIRELVCKPSSGS